MQSVLFKPAEQDYTEFLVFLRRLLTMESTYCVGEEVYKISELISHHSQM